MCLSCHHLSLICNTSSPCDYSPKLTRANVCLSYKVNSQSLAMQLLGSKSGAAFKSKVSDVKRCHDNLCCLDGMNFSEAGVKGAHSAGQHRSKRERRWVIAMWRVCVGGRGCWTGTDRVMALRWVKLNKGEDKWDPDLPWMPTILFQLAGCLVQRQDLDTLLLGMIHSSSPPLMTFTSVITLLSFISHSLKFRFQELCQGVATSG